MAAKTKENYIYAIGRRKESSARVHLKAASEETGVIKVNGKELTEYFPMATTQMVINQPFVVTENEGKFDLRVTVAGGGKSGQAGAVRLGIARALEKQDPELRAVLKKAGLLSRDSRAVERKKPGRHKARKKPQFSKR